MIDFCYDCESGSFRNIYKNVVLGFSVGNKSLIWIPYNKHSFIPRSIKLVDNKLNVSSIGISELGYDYNLMSTEMPVGYALHFDGKKFTFLRKNGG